MVQITVLIVDCVDYDRAKLALDHCSYFGKPVLLSHFNGTIPKISSKQEYSNFMIKEVANYFDTEHVLIIQWDGWILNPDKWEDEFLNYDYIGAPWPVELLGTGVCPEYTVGNGGFSLRSKALCKFLQTLPLQDLPEDVLICQIYRPLLEQVGFKFAPEDVAQRFSNECGAYYPSFGQHARNKLVKGATVAHLEQMQYCQAVKFLFSENFKNKVVLDVGSLNINGCNRPLFTNCIYTGIDIGPGPNVDVVCPAHLHTGSYDTIISTECFEHDPHFNESIKNIACMLKPGGLFVFTCATTGRPEHGTTRTDTGSSPFTNDYYKNLVEEDFVSILDNFSFYKFDVDETDLRFFGFKKL